MPIALSRASGRVVLLLFFCWDSLAFRSNDDSLFLFLFNELVQGCSRGSRSRVPRGSGSGEKAERRIVSSDDSSLHSSGE